MIQLNPFAISGLLIIITYLPLFLLILFKGKTRAARLFALHIFAIFWWGVGSFWIGINKNELIALSLMKFAYIGVIFIPVFFYDFVLEIINNNSKLIRSIFYAQAIYFLFATLTNKIFLYPKWIFHSFYYTSPSIIFFFSFIIWLIIVSLAHIQLIQFYRNIYPKKREQILLLCIGTIIGFVGGTLNFFPQFTEIIYPYGNFLIPFHSVILMFTILKYQLLDISVVIKKSIAYSILIAIVSISYLLIVVLAERFFQGIIGYSSILVTTFTAFLLGVIFFPLRNKIQYFIDRLFFQGSTIEIAQQNELLRQELIRSEKLKSIATLASGIAHEIKNPLTALKTFAEYLPRKKDDDAFINKFSRIVKSEVDRIDHLVHQLLDFAKPAPLQPRPVNIHELFDDILDFLNNEFVKRKINIQKNYDSNTALSIHADPVQLKQAFLNIFLNAIDALAADGKITITTTLKEIWVEIMIQDTGCGISKEDLTHIFDPFFTKKDHGTGLGLSVTHGIIKQHQGQIHVESVVGKGTKFTIKLPP